MRSLSKGGDLLVIYYSVFGTKRMALLDIKRASCFLKVSICKILSSLPFIKSFVFFFFSFLTVKLNQMLS